MRNVIAGRLFFCTFFPESIEKESHSGILLVETNFFSVNRTRKELQTIWADLTESTF